MTTTEDRSESTAQVFADVLDFPIYVSHLDDQTPMIGGPWRGWDFAAAVIGLGMTARESISVSSRGMPRGSGCLGSARPPG